MGPISGSVVSGLKEMVKALRAASEGDWISVPEGSIQEIEELAVLYASMKPEAVLGPELASISKKLDDIAFGLSELGLTSAKIDDRLSALEDSLARR